MIPPGRTDINRRPRRTRVRARRTRACLFQTIRGACLWPSAPAHEGLPSIAGRTAGAMEPWNKGTVSFVTVD